MRSMRSPRCLYHAPNATAIGRRASEFFRRANGTLALGAVCLLAAGCSSKSELIGVSGEVTFDGQPIASGEIVFKPTKSGDRPAMGTIVEGNYQIAKKYGAKPGNYTVSIKANRPTGTKGTNPYAPDAVPTEQYIPQKYNDTTTLEAVITSEGKAHDFNLDSKK